MGDREEDNILRQVIQPERLDTFKWNNASSKCLLDIVNSYVEMTTSSLFVDTVSPAQMQIWHKIKDLYHRDMTVVELMCQAATGRIKVSPNISYNPTTF